MLFAIGAGPQVVAVDSYSDYPPEAPHTKISAFDPDVETIVAEHPDLVILSYDAQGIVAKLTQAGIPVIEATGDSASTIDGAYAQMEMIGDATGNGAKARAVVASMQAKLKEIVASTAKPAKPLTYYHELDSQFHTLTSATFAGQIYSLFGLQNIADKAQAKGGDYPQLSAEYIISAKPDLIFLADEGGSAQPEVDVAKRPGWDSIPAVHDGHVVALNPDIASRWGPRIVDFAQAVSNAINALN
jgi:iron complex transport system substrate-binding protein